MSIIDLSILPKYFLGSVEYPSYHVA